MLHVDVVCVGSLKERYLREACAEYEKRLGGFCRLTVTEVGEERLPDKPSEAAVAAALQAEGRRLLDKVPENALLTALCIEGKEMSSDVYKRQLILRLSAAFPRNAAAFLPTFTIP